MSPEVRKQIKVRAAAIGDLEPIREIYNYYVETSTATFDTAPEAPTQRLDWFAHHQKEELPVIVAEVDGQIVAWGSLSYYNDRCAYRTTVEPSIYVHHQHLREGLGKELMKALISLAQSRSYHCLIGKICSENETSLRLCESFGFETVGELKEVGHKFNRWLNVTLVQKLLKP